MPKTDWELVVERNQTGERGMRELYQDNMRPYEEYKIIDTDGILAVPFTTYYWCRNYKLVIFVVRGAAYEPGFD